LNTGAQLHTIPYKKPPKHFRKLQSEKHHISSAHANVRHAISTKICMVIEVVRAIILLFWLPYIVLPLGGVENLAESEIAPIEVNC